jgi:hypothetical protein
MFALDAASTPAAPDDLDVPGSDQHVSDRAEAAEANLPGLGSLSSTHAGTAGDSPATLTPSPSRGPVLPPPLQQGLGRSSNPPGRPYQVSGGTCASAYLAVAIVFDMTV